MTAVIVTVWGMCVLVIVVALAHQGRARLDTLNETEHRIDDHETPRTPLPSRTNDQHETWRS